ncbi:isoprenylcysteine carboxylmethyltransferase family protein [Reyranella sp. CPCC 100927]|uniref:methyltransferase family protein n=1 Tax=Reyranella sp. CPCC 100927 TaxID=2599616 RepID=UPI0011B72E8D|nr:isoprenylcysteine carboxylmethyltransferase family protein [Reyranella sp. CPCC 100927]TWT10209.1 isoprenylcysteine carboxylmethyltransferase family protein [Reyranella sp. CPCC 100927]
MMIRIEDLLGKFLMTAVFAYLAMEQVVSIAAAFHFRHATPAWELTLVSRVVSLIFMAMVVFFTVTRLPPKGSASGIEPRLTAIAGTFILMVLIVLPPGNVPQELRLLATVLIIVGTTLSIYCLWWLGQSFSIMASSRRLITHGPYAFVRHPLYIAEAVTVVGILIANWSLVAVIVGIAQFALQFRRMQNEERVLRKTFAEYDDYARRVPMIIPHAALWRRA